MRTGREFYVDVALVFFIALVFALMVIQMVRRSRHPDGLSWSLIVLFASLSIGYAIAGLGALHVITPLLPTWVRWMLRVSIAGSGSTVVVMLARGERRTWKR